MTDYDDTNRGAGHQPFDSQQLLLTGNLHFDQDKQQICLMKDKDRDGKDILVIFKRVGCMWQNEDADETNNKPHWSGPMDDNMRLAGWRRTSGEGKPYMQLQRSAKMNGKASSKPAPVAENKEPVLADDIPF